MQVRLLPDALFLATNNPARSSIGTGRRPLKPQRRVRLPHGSLNLERKTEPAGLIRRGGPLAAEQTSDHDRPSGGTGRHATLRMSCPGGVGVRLSPWSLDTTNRQFAQREFTQMTQGGQCPVEPHKLHRPGATPGPATDRTKEIVKKRPSTQTGKAAVSSAVTLWVRLPLSVNLPDGEGPKSTVQGQKR